MPEAGRVSARSGVLFNLFFSSSEDDRLFEGTDERWDRMSGIVSPDDIEEGDSFLGRSKNDFG